MPPPENLDKQMGTNTNMPSLDQPDQQIGSNSKPISAYPNMVDHFSFKPEQVIK